VAEEDMQDQALSGLKVLDVSHHIAGPYCTKLLADFGAQLIKVERPDGGDPARRTGPFRDDKPGPESSVFFFYLNNNKQGITLNLKTDTGINIFKELVKKVDILVENFSPHVMPGLGLSYDTLKAINPGLVMTSISNFGQTGPYRNYKATDIVLQALGGWLSPRGEPTREPVRAGGRLRTSEFIGGMYAAVATMTAFAYKVQTGQGQHVDVSLVESVADVTPHAVEQNTFPDNRPWPKIRTVFSPGVEECKDGYIGINVLSGQHWASLCDMMGMKDWAENPDYTTMLSRFLHREEIQKRMNPWLMKHTKEEIMKEGQDWRVPVAPVYNTEDMLKSPQHEARDYFVKVKHKTLGDIIQPGAIFRMTETPWQMKRPAPCLGDHNKEIYCGLLGYSIEDLVRLRQADVI